MSYEYPGREHYEGVKPDWDTELGAEHEVGFVVVVHNGQTIVAPLHHVRTQIAERRKYRRAFRPDPAAYENTSLEILVNVRGITDHYRIYDGTPADFVNGQGRYADETEQQALEQGRKEIEE